MRCDDNLLKRKREINWHV